MDTLALAHRFENEVGLSREKAERAVNILQQMLVEAEHKRRVTYIIKNIAIVAIATIIITTSVMFLSLR